MSIGGETLQGTAPSDAEVQGSNQPNVVEGTLPLPTEDAQQVGRWGDPINHRKMTTKEQNLQSEAMNQGF